MGFNYGQFRNRGESLPAIQDTVLASLGEVDIKFDQYDIQQVADHVNRRLDKVQEDYNERFNFPNTRKTPRR